MIRKYLPKTTEDLIRWYERVISPIGLIGGFVLDSLVLLKRVDALMTNVLLGSYLVIVALGIILMQALEAGHLRRLHPVAPFIPVVVQFSFGGLFSGFLSLYSRSATFALSWIFIGAVALLLLGNERFIRLYRKFSFQVGMFYTALLMFMIFFIPVLLLRIAPSIFVLSCVVSILVVAVLQLILRRVARQVPLSEWRAAGRAIITVTIGIVALYFTNAMPPLPLSLKDVGVYHSIVREGGEYIARGESHPWYASFSGYQVHLIPSESVYVYTAIFAPTGLSLGVIHEWQRYDEAAQEWVVVNDLRFTVQGGRDMGYRGYSFMRTPQVGLYRVGILTEHGQVIGHVRFTVEAASSPADLVVRQL